MINLIKKILHYFLIISLIIIGIIGLIKESYNSYLIIEGQTWKPYFAKIKSSHIKKVSTKGGNKYYGKMEYDFFIYNNKLVKGNTFTLSHNSFTIKERNEYLEKYKKNKKVQIYMSFKNPQHSSVIKPKLSYLFFECFIIMLSIMMIRVGLFLGEYIVFDKKSKIQNIYYWWIIYSIIMFYFLFLAILIDILGKDEIDSFRIAGIITFSILAFYFMKDVYRSKTKKNSKFMGKRYWIRKDSKIFKRIVYIKFILGFISLLCVIYLLIKIFI